jgi:NADH:ubiquinone reductase (H+-translocating)
MVDQKNNRPRVVIVGAGFGGINAAKYLADADVDVLLIDRRNYHLFQPLLYQVATAGLSPSDIAYPVRAIFRRQKNFEFRLAEVQGIDLQHSCLSLNGDAVNFDFLILAVGGETNFFGMQSLEQNAFELKDLHDAENIRNQILRMFELAEYEQDPGICQALRTFVIVGGGPTGVECAGAMSELIRRVLSKDFQDLDVNAVRIILLEMQDNLLPGFPPKLGRAAASTLRHKFVDVRLGEIVESYDGSEVKLKSGEVIRAYTLIWAAGIRAASLVDRLMVQQARQARVVVEQTLQVPGHPNILVIGDAAYLEAHEEPLPMVAPVAIQQAKTAARNIKKILSGDALENFEFKDPGSLATVGRNAAVAHVWGIKFYGFLAWLVWLAVHLFWLIGFRNRLLVLIAWAWDYFLYERAVRLITPSSE